MDNDTTEHAAQVGLSLIDHWPFIVFAIGMLGGWITWALRRTFTTHTQMDACKDELAQERLHLESINSQEHKEIRKDMADNHAELLRILIEKEKNNEQTFRKAN